jgi:hypothetical protein
MPKKTKDTKGEAKGPQGKGKANGQAKPNGKAEAKLPGSYARFKGDFSANAQIRAKAPKLLAFKTYGKLAEHIRKSFAAGQTKAQVAEGLGVTAARVNELAVCLRIEQPKARGTGETIVCGPAIAANVPIDPLTGKPIATKAKA